jgi:arylformamidase
MIKIALGFLALPIAVFADNLIAHRDIPYVMPQKARQTLDLYTVSRNERSTARPVVIWIHGGGWHQGDKSTLAIGKPEQHLLKPRLFVDAGCVFVAINYRFIPEVTLQEMAGDVAKAIGWVHRNVLEYGGNPDTLFVMGHSAGAQLAALVCTDARYMNAEQVSFGKLRGCVPVDGDTYFPALQIHTSPAKEASYRRTFPLGSDIELSSVVHVYRNKNIPPFLLVYIAEDPKSGTDLQARVLAKSLNDIGVSADLLAVPEKSHRTLNADLGLPNDIASESILAFVKKNSRDG